MHQHFSTYFASLVERIVACLPDDNLWLPFNIRWRKFLMWIFSLMGAVW